MIGAPRMDAWRVAEALVVGLAAAACAPSTANGPASGLIAPPTVSVVAADPSLASTSSVRAQALPNFPPDSDFFVDTVHQFTHDRSIDALDLVNQVLCLVAQAEYAQHLNSGPYLAQIDTGVCGAASGIINGPGQGKTLQNWIVNSLRRRTLDPQVVQFWVPAMIGSAPTNPRVTLFSQLEVTGVPGGTNPFGLFRMNFAGAPPNGTPQQPDYCGLLSAKNPGSGRIGYEYFFLVGDVNKVPPVGRQFELTQINVDFSPDLLQGIAHVAHATRFNDPQTGDTGILRDESRLAFDSTTVVRSLNGGAPHAFSRSTFQIENQRSNLYDNSLQNGGTRVALKTGTPIQLVDGTHGFVDYHGLFVPPGSQAVDGDVVHQEINGAVDPTPLTLRIAPGKLIEVHRQTTPMSMVDGAIFDWDEPFNPNATPPPPNRYQLVYDFGKNTFSEFARFDFSTNQYVPIPPKIVNPANFGVLRMSSKRYGGNVAYIDGDTVLHWYTEKIADDDPNLFGGGSTLVLFGYIGCTRSGITQTQAEMGDVDFPPPISANNPFRYEFHKTDFTLYSDDGLGNLTPAGLAPGAVPLTGPYVNGLRSGPLVTSTAGIAQPVDIFDVPLFYVYETGANAFNQWVGLIDSQGNALQFQSPIQFLYTHKTTADVNGDASQDGKEFVLEYRGDGQLLGIPMTKIDTDDDGVPDHDVPLFNILDGVAMGPTGNEFVVKAVRREIILTALPSVPPGLDPTLADRLVLPDGRFYVTPTIGPVPPVNAPPPVLSTSILPTSRR